ncbi:hypothetical protein FSP39_016364 [Pinctada imbricata]|uniref:C2H2-type domain-containing protein n=1 Tax=Pinctada imbricata TaxID=66713 RepID=A0AA89BRC9_PINIB|nr:hypothetical protein FSP39_016364 [Pinctada imbricata]
MSDSEEDDTDNIDFSVISNSIEIGGTMVEQIMNGIHYGSAEVRNLLRNECDFIMECKVCRNLFRSFPNFVAHKRVYCTEIYASRLFNPISSLSSQRTSEETVVVQPTSPTPSTESKKSQKQKPANVVEELKKKQKPTNVVEELKKNSFNGKSSAYKVYSKASEKVEAEKIKTKVSKVVLTPISTNPNAMFVSVSSDSSSKTEKSGTEKSDFSSTKDLNIPKSTSVEPTPKSVTSETMTKSATSQPTLKSVTSQLTPKSVTSHPTQSATTSALGDSMLRRILERRDEPKTLNKIIVEDKTPEKTSIALSRSPRKKREEVNSGSVSSTKTPVRGEGNTKSAPKSPVKEIGSVPKSPVKGIGSVTKTSDKGTRDTNLEKSKEPPLLGKVSLRPVQSNLGSEHRSNLTKLSKQGFVHISRLQCLICGSVFASKKSLSNHMSYTHSEKMFIYPCLLCSKKYNRFFGVTRHLQKYHNQSHQDIIKMTPKLKEIAYENTQLNARNQSVKAAKGKMIQTSAKAKAAPDEEDVKVKTVKKYYKSSLRFERQKKIIVVPQLSKSSSPSKAMALYKCTGCEKTFLKRASCSEHVRICQAVNFPLLSAKFAEKKRPKNKLQQKESEEQQSSGSEEESMCISEEGETLEQRNIPVKESPKKSKEDKDTSPIKERVIQTRRSAAAQYMKTRFLDKRRAIVKQNAIKTSRSASARNVSKKEASTSKSGTPEKTMSPKKSNSSDQQDRNSSADRNLFNLFNKIWDSKAIIITGFREKNFKVFTFKSNTDGNKIQAVFSLTLSPDKKSDVSRSSTPLSESKTQKATSNKGSIISSCLESNSRLKSADEEKQETPSDSASLSSATRLKEQDLGSESEVSDYDGPSRVIVTSVKDAKTKRVASRGKRSKHIFALQGKISADESDLENGNSDDESGSSEKEEDENKEDVDTTKCESPNQVQEVQESRSRRKQKMVVREIDEVDGSSFDEKSTKSKSGSRKSTGKITDEKKSKSSASKEKSPVETRRSRNFDDTGKISLDNIIYTSRERKLKSRNSDDSNSDTNQTQTKNSSKTEQSPSSNMEDKTGATKTKNEGSESMNAGNVDSKDNVIHQSVQLSSKALKLVPYPSTSTGQNDIVDYITHDSDVAGTTRIRHRSLESYSVPLGNVEQVSIAGARLVPNLTNLHMKSVQNKNLEELFNKKLMDASIRPTRGQILNERQNLLANCSVKDVTQNKNVVCIEEIWVDKKHGEPLEKVKTNTIVVQDGKEVPQPETIVVEKPTKPAAKKMYVIDLDSTGETKPKCLDSKHIESLIDSNSLKCKHCCTTFASYGNLRRHVVRHLGWKRYKCKLCKFTSYNRSECSTHLLRAHAEKCITTSVSSYIIDLNKEASKARTQKKQQTLQKNLQSGEEEEDQTKRKMNLRRGAQQKNDNSKKSPIKKGKKKTPSESNVKSDDDTPQSNTPSKNSSGRNTGRNRKRKRSLDDEEGQGERKARFDAGQSESPRKRSASYDEACTNRPLSKNEIHDLCDELTSASDTENDQNSSTSPVQKLEPNVATMASVLEWAKRVRFTKKGRSNLRRLSSPVKKEEKPDADDVMSKSLDGTSSSAMELHEGSAEVSNVPTSSNNDAATGCRQQTKTCDVPILSKITVKEEKIEECS